MTWTAHFLPWFLTASPGGGDTGAKHMRGSVALSVTFTQVREGADNRGGAEQTTVGDGGDGGFLNILGEEFSLPLWFLRRLITRPRSSFLPLCVSLSSSFPQLVPSHFMSTSKSSTSSLVSSVPLRLPTAHTSLVLEARMRHTTPPLPPLSRVTRLRMNSPVFRSHSLTVPSSELVMTKFLLNWRHVTALWCLCGPEQERQRVGEGRRVGVKTGGTQD